MTSQEYQQAFDSLGKQGFCLSQVSGYSVASRGGQPGSLCRDLGDQELPGVHGASRHDVSAVPAGVRPARTAGLSSATVSGYQVNGEPRYAAIWDKSSGPSFVARHGMTADQYQKAFDQLVGLDGFRLAWIDGD